MPHNETEKLDGLRTYIDGKMKRYNLLFAVNGGAFAIAKLMGQNTHNIGGLTLKQLAIGAMIFTVVMTLDIWLWGQMMRKDFFSGGSVFTPIGKAILLLLAFLLILGWGLAAFGCNMMAY